jgi:hypothetical protein
MDYYCQIGKDETIDELRSISDFILNDINKTMIGENEFCFSYSPHDKTLTHNANVLGASFLHRLGSLLKDDDLLEISRKAYQFTINKQNEDGSWNYSEKKGGFFGKQIDYHQGFILDALISYLGMRNDEDLRDCIIRGLDYYWNNLFSHEGRAYFRYPRKWPTDTHAQAQGLITFSKASILDKRFGEYANLIFDWAIGNMYNGSYFYFYKYHFLKNKINYLRWCQSWMLKAVNIHIYYRREKEPFSF